jgi:hypothetical protein
MLRGDGLAEARRDLDVVVGRLGDRDRLGLERRLADERLADLEAVGQALALLVAVGRDEPQLGVVGRPAVAVALGEEERAVLGADQRGDLGHDQARDLVEIALALHEAGDAREVRVQPVLLRVALGRDAEVLDHLVDDVLELATSPEASTVT